MTKRLLLDGGMLVGGAMLVAACWSDDLTGATTTGTYTLQTVNGLALPYVLSQSGNSKTELLAESYALYQGQTYARSRNLRTTVAGQTATADSAEVGVYGTQGTSITFTRSDGTTQRLGIINGKTMTFVEAGVTAVLQK